MTSLNLGRGPHDWEIDQLGESTVDRIKNVADDISAYNKVRNVENVDRERLYDHSIYIHTMGAQMMQIQRSVSNAKKQNIDPVSESTKKIPRIPRKRITVAETEKNSKMIAMDLEWDTSSWSQEEIESGCDTLIAIFMKSEITDAYEEQALKMLEKLLMRHKSAVGFMRKNIESLVGKAVSRRVTGSECGGILQLLHVLNGCTSRFSKELSTFNTVCRIFEMLLVESRVAAVLIQHTFRVHIARSKPRASGAYDDDFGSKKEVERQIRRTENARSTELRNRWRSMHAQQSQSTRLSLYGLRGAVQVGTRHMKLCLSIVGSLVSETAGDTATGNREDVVRSGGLSLLASLAYATAGAFAKDAMRIIANTAKAPESLVRMVRSGCVESIFEYLRFMRRTVTDSTVADLQDPILAVTRLGETAAGLCRARGHYATLRRAEADTEEINYDNVLASLSPDFTISELRASLGHPELLKELVAVLIHSKHFRTLSNTLTCLFTLACSECYTSVLTEILAMGSRGLVRTVDLLEEADETVCKPAMYLLLQLCTKADGRNGFLTARLPDLMAELTHSTTLYEKASYQRAILVLTSMCKLTDWNAYDPAEMHTLFAKKTAVLSTVYMDLLATIKLPPVVPGVPFEFYNLQVRSTDKASGVRLSKAVEKTGPKEICEFFVKPVTEGHYSALPYELATSGCIILEAIVMDPASAKFIVSIASVRYLGQSTYVSFLELCERSLAEAYTTVMLHAVSSSLKALRSMCNTAVKHPEHVAAVKQGVLESHAVSAANFFAMTLATIHPSLSRYPDLKLLQERVAMAALGFLDSYAALNLASNDVDSLRSMGKIVGPDMAMLTSCLKTVHGVSERRTHILDKTCLLLFKLIAPTVLVPAALKQWKLASALQVHLPPPSSHKASSETSTELTTLPSSFIEVFANIGATEQGKAICFSEGFLRRALEKTVLLMRLFYSFSPNTRTTLASSLLDRTGTIKSQLSARATEFSTTKFHQADSSSLKSVLDDLCPCFKAIGNCANFTSPKLGNANDLIFQTEYQIIASITAVLQTLGLAKSETIRVQSLHTLSLLSKDVTNAYDEFTSNTVIDVLQSELDTDYSELTEVMARDLIVCVHNISSSLKDTLLAHRMLQGLKDSVYRVVRLFPDLSDLVQNALWSISSHSPTAYKKGLPQPAPAADFAELLRVSVAEERETNRAFGTDDVDYQLHRPGTHAHCGVTTCGSLRLSESVHLHTHGRLDSSASTDMLAGLVVSEGDCDVSKDSARDDTLKNELLKRKFVYGYAKNLAPKSAPSAEMVGPEVCSSTVKSASNSCSLPSLGTSTSGKDFYLAKAAGGGPRLEGKLSSNCGTGREGRSLKDKNRHAQTYGGKINDNRLASVSPVSSAKGGGAPAGLKTIDISDLPELFMTRPPPPRGTS